MKATIFALSIAMLAISLRAQDQQDPALKIIPTWIPSPDLHSLSLSVWNTGTDQVSVASAIAISRAVPNPPKEVPKPAPDDPDSVQLFIEFAAKAGQDAANVPASLSTEVGDGPVNVTAGESSQFKYTLGENFIAAAKAYGEFTCRARYHGKLLGEDTFNANGKRVRDYDARRQLITTYTYDDSGKPTGQWCSLPDDPDLRKALAAKEKELLARMRAAGDNQRMRQDVIHDMMIFYANESLEYDKAANLQFAMTNPADVYSLKLMLSGTCKTFVERNKKLQELIQLFPDKKAFTENLMTK